MICSMLCKPPKPLLSRPLVRALTSQSAPRYLAIADGSLICSVLGRSAPCSPGLSRPPHFSVFSDICRRLLCANWDLVFSDVTLAGNITSVLHEYFMVLRSFYTRPERYLAPGTWYVLSCPDPHAARVLVSRASTLVAVFARSSAKRHGRGRAPARADTGGGGVRGHCVVLLLSDRGLPC